MDAYRPEAETHYFEEAESLAQPENLQSPKRTIALVMEISWNSVATIWESSNRTREARKARSRKKDPTTKCSSSVLSAFKLSRISSQTR